MKLFAIVAAAVVVVGGGAYFALMGAKEAPVPVAATTCTLEDDGQLGPASEVRFTAAYPAPFDGIAGVNLTDRLQDACDALLQRGFTLADTQGQGVNVTNVPSSIADTQHVARYTAGVRMDGEIENPFDGAVAPASFELNASSPATYSGIEYFRSFFDYAEPVTPAVWADHMVAQFGTPSSGGLERGRFYWVLSKDGVDPRGPDEACDTDIAAYNANGWVELPKIMDQVPQHDGAACRVLVMADGFGSADHPGLITRVGIRMVDYASVAANRQVEQAFVDQLRAASD